jgi:hypothetical protein
LALVYDWQTQHAGDHIFDCIRWSLLCHKPCKNII